MFILGHINVINIMNINIYIKVWVGGDPKKLPCPLMDKIEVVMAGSLKSRVTLCERVDWPNANELAIEPIQCQIVFTLGTKREQKGEKQHEINMKSACPT